ncbi:MAG: prepilin-type N-terminal cleavage/methylation domain-containing protein [Thermodesulfobacteriota bacterium]
MKITSKQDGFTLAEILIAVAIMGLGFLAVAEMQYLSLRQKQKSEFGSVATNIIQFVADKDMEEVRRLHLLNTIAHSATVAGRVPDFSYCDGSAPSDCTNPPCADPCTGCPGQPCDTMRVLSVAQIPDPPAGFDEHSCAPIETNDSDPEKLVFETDVNNCTDPDADMYIIKNVRASQQQDPATLVQILTVTLTYAVKTPGQFGETGLTIIDPNNNNRPILRNSVATQTYIMTAHIDDWSQIIAGWTQVRVPHIP